VKLHITNEQAILELVKTDEWMMSILFTIQTLDLPDWWVCAGFVRSKIWDTIHGFDKRTPIPDVDVIYFDPTNIEEVTEKKLEEKLKNMLPDVPWSVKNEARMHVVNNIPPYTSSVDAISKFPETVTALGLKIDKNNNLVLTAPHGVADTINCLIKPTPYFAQTKARATIFEGPNEEKELESNLGQGESTL
jgi:hypothetical protein